MVNILLRDLTLRFVTCQCFYRVYLLVECRGLNVEGEGKKSRARVKSRG